MSHWTQPQALDRCEDHRNDPEWVAAAWSDTQARVLGVDADGLLEWQGGLVWRSTTGSYDPSSHFLMGLLAGAPVFATAAAGGEVGLRAVMDDLSEVDVEVAFTAVGLIGWHGRAAFCPACGSRSAPISGGLARRCPACAREDYPRTDPAVIMAVTDADDRLLLARQPSWVSRRFSVLAGFAEVGESLEQAVHREVAEEVGLSLASVTYLGSQPWPFPRSMMVAFAAHASSTELRPAQAEVADAGWFTRAELRARLADGSMSLPLRTSIARRMIESWMAGELNPQAVAMWGVGSAAPE